jgi:GNAT superfamily N-acetyltransferase
VSEGHLVAVSADERPRALATLVAAFVNDPVERWLYPEARAYLDHFPRFVEAFAGRAFAAQTAWAIEDYGAVALWLPPGTGSDGDAVASAVERTVAPARYRDTVAVLKQLADAHPSEAHWYLALLGVDSARQGLGLGGRLLAACLTTVDADHLPAYLETPNPRTVPFYQRHGFAVTGRVQAGACPPLVSTLRPAR